MDGQRRVGECQLAKNRYYTNYHAIGIRPRLTDENENHLWGRRIRCRMDNSRPCTIPLEPKSGLSPLLGNDGELGGHGRPWGDTHAGETWVCGRIGGKPLSLFGSDIHFASSDPIFKSKAAVR